MPGVTSRCARSHLWQVPDQRGEDGAVGPVEPGLGMSSAQHGDLVAQYQQLDVLEAGERLSRSSQLQSRAKIR